MSSFSNHLTPTSEPNLAKFHGEVALSDYIREISVEGYEDRFLKTITRGRLVHDPCETDSRQKSG